MTEDELLRLLDGEDNTVLQVCADWLEGNGQLPAATLLRLEHRLRSQRAPKDLMALGAEASTLAATTPPRWVAALARRSPIGSWRGHDSDQDAWGFRYLASGKLHYTNGGDTHKDGLWTQIGSVLVMSTNKKFTSYVGLLTEGQIVGAARTKNDLKWTWEMTPVAPRPKKQPPATKKPAPTPAKKRGTAKNR